jgi:hypothetical protein
LFVSWRPAKRCDTVEGAELPVCQRIGAAGCCRTGHYPEYCGAVFRRTRPASLSWARGALSDGSYLARYAIRHYGAVVVSVESVKGTDG